MKNAILIIFLFTFPLIALSQITVMNANDIIGIERYDSLTNISYENIPSQIGQTLFLVGSFYTEKGFNCFSVEPTFDILPHNLYKPIVIQTEYGERVVSDRLSLIGKYYKVIDILSKKKVISSIYCMKLVELESNDTLYFVTDETSDRCSEFINVGYFEKTKSSFVGKRYYSTGYNWGITTLDTDKKIDLPYKSIFLATDIIVKEGSNNLYLRLENPQYGAVKELISNISQLSNFITEEKYDSYIEKYGKVFGDYISQKRIKIGMSRNMVLASWGNPDNINVSEGIPGWDEQWVYKRGDYLYFENDKLVSFQRF